MDYRLGLNIDTNSIAWNVIELGLRSENDKYIQPLKIIDMGVHAFSDGRKIDKFNPNIPGDSLASERLLHRMARKNTQRKAKRRRRLYKILQQSFGLKNTKEPLDILMLRSEALKRSLTTEELGAILLSLLERRGFQSNRKDKQEEGGKLKKAIKKLEIYKNDKTLGQYLYDEREKGNKIKFSITAENEEDKLFYSRKMVQEEFIAIWQYQMQYHLELMTWELYTKINDIVFDKPTLKPKLKGKCTFVENDERLARALPSAQYFRIVKEVNNLRLTSPKGERNIPLTLDQLAIFYKYLCQRDLTFTGMRKLLGKEYESHKFNLESKKRLKLSGAPTAGLMRKEEYFGPRWDNIPLNEQDRIITQLLDNSIKDEEIISYLHNNHNIPLDRCEEILQITLPAGTIQFGATVINAILPHMVNDGMTEPAALLKCGFDFRKDKNHHDLYNELPYYGEILHRYISIIDPKNADADIRKYGRIASPTVHIGLNIIRKLVNKIIKKYGSHPQDIHIHVTKKLKKSIKILKDIEKEKAANKKTNAKRNNEIEDYLGRAPNFEERLKYRLWHELSEDPMQRKCILSGETIGITNLFSDAIRIGYILPLSRTLDTSGANQILMTAQVHCLLRSQTPFEVWGKTPEYEDILERAKTLPENKEWRFYPHAMQTFEDRALDIKISRDQGCEESTIQTDIDIFAIKPLSDEEYITRLFREYLAAICPNNKKSVCAVTENMMTLLSLAAGIHNIIDKIDYRTNIIPSIIASLMTPTIIKIMANAAYDEEQTGIKMLKNLSHYREYLLPEFSNINVIKQKLNNIIVSQEYKNTPRTGTLHEAKKHGIVRNIDNKTTLLRSTIPLSKIKSLSDIKYICQVQLRYPLYKFISRDVEIKDLMKELIEKEKAIDKKTLKKSIITLKESIYDRIQCLIKVFFERKGDILPEKVYIQYPTNNKFIIKGKKEAVYSGNNNSIVIYADPDNKWHSEIIHNFDAQQQNYKPEWQLQGNNKLIMCLYKNSSILYKENHEIKIVRVKKFIKDNITVVPHFIIPSEEKNKMYSLSLKQLRIKKGRILHMPIDGLNLQDKIIEKLAC